jgi:hypothetical protein
VSIVNYKLLAKKYTKRSDVYVYGSLPSIKLHRQGGNGTIDSGRELFGDNTALPGYVAGSPGSAGLASNGYQALAQHDSNHDGQINSQDAVYSQLRVWRDLNQDGISQTGELQTLQSLGIAGVGVVGAATNTSLGNGNTQIASGSFTRTDGSAGQSGVAELTGNRNRHIFDSCLRSIRLSFRGRHDDSFSAACSNRY